MGLNISICYKGPELFLKGDTILNTDITCCFQKWLQLHPGFTLSSALRGSCEFKEEMLSPSASCCPTSAILLDFKGHQIFSLVLATCLHPLCMEWRIKYIQGMKAGLRKFWKSGSWVRGPSGISTNTAQLTPWYDILVTITIPSSFYAPEVCENLTSHEES